MKKTLLTMAVALALVGCSKSELVETPIQEQNAIAFGTYVGDNAQTRASVVTTETLGVDGFGVNAYYTGQDEFNDDAELNFMHNTKVTYNKDNQKWEYSPVKYWPNNSGDKVSFFAYGPYAKSAGDNNITQNGTSLDFVVPAEVKNQVDLIYNTNYDGTINKTKPSVEELIHFQFGHALSRISFTVEAAVDEVVNGNNLLDGNTRINVKKVALVSDTYDEANLTGPFYTGGTLSLLNPDTADDGTPNSPWSEETGSQGFVFNATNHFYHTVKDVDAENMTGDKIDVVQLTRFNASEPQRLLNDSSYLMVIPQIDAEFKIYIEYDVISGGYENNGGGTYDESAITNKITSAETLTVTFEQGKAYNFNLVLGMTSVKINADVTEWDDEIEGGDEWLPGDEDDADELIATNLVYNTDHKIVIDDATDLAEVRDLINDREIYKVNYQETDDTGNYYKVYKVNVNGEPDEEYKSFHEAYLMQVADIDLSAYDNWVPIGSSYETSFEGRYEVDKSGDHTYTISSLTIKETTGDYAGLFGYTTAIIENVEMVSVNIGTEDAPVEANYAAAIAGHADGSLTDCSVTSGAIYGTQVAAGLAAGGNNAFFTNCSNAATISGSGDAAGIYAGNGGLIDNCGNTAAVTSTMGKAAGITIYTPEITNAKNSGNISGYEYAGGIAANHHDIGSKIVASYNTGRVTCSNGYAGGIVGISHGESYKACYNTADEISGKSAGGIIGHWSINGSETPLDAQLTSCYSTTATITANDGTAGALCGEVHVEKNEEVNTVTYTSCYYSSFTANAIGNNADATGITKVDSSEGNTWTEATAAMNTNISGWVYSSESGAAPTLSVAP